MARKACWMAAMPGFLFLFFGAGAPVFCYPEKI
jgi:hypothetical protein